MKIKREVLKLYAVTDRRWLKENETLCDVVEELLQAGVSCVQLREKEADDKFFLQEAKELNEVCSLYGIPLIINDRPDIAKKAGAAGVHVGQSDMAVEAARELLGEGFIIGTSAHNVEEAQKAESAGADYIGCGAVFGSKTKSSATLLSVEELKKICESVDIPVAAIGGITEENIMHLAGTKIAGVAVVSGLFASEDKMRAARQFLRDI